MSAIPAMSNLDDRKDLSLEPEDEARICADRDALADQLRLTLERLGADVPDGSPHVHRAALRTATGNLTSQSSLARDARRLQRAIDRLNWRLALSGMDQVRHQLRRRRYVRVERDELRQAGLMGLHEAARRFDTRKGVRFSTYCRYWVRDAMGETVGRLEYAARLPSKARRQLTHDADTLAPRQARALSRVKRAVDLDAPLPGAGDGGTRGDHLAHGGESPETDVMATAQIQRLASALDEAKLGDRDRHILHHRFELGGAEHLTNRELGEELGISGERVRQLQKRAVARLRDAYQAA